MSIYQHDEQADPDEGFDAGVFEHLVAGNTGRLLDPRRTPVRIVSLHEATATFRLRIEGFEDEGAIWEVPFEHVGDYQFVRGSARAAPERVSRYREASNRLDRKLVVPAQRAALPGTHERLRRAREHAARWLERHSRWFAEGARLPEPATRTGSPSLARDLKDYLGEAGLASLEQRFARQFVSNPRSGELVKGHRLVIAALGLVDFEGEAIRDPALFDGDLSRARRAEHIVARMGFVRAWLGAAGLRFLHLHRGVSGDEPIGPARNRTFVSTSFSLEVASSHFTAAPEGGHRLIVSADIPIERVFMTYVETAEMNAPFKEAEAVLLHEPGRRAF